MNETRPKLGINDEADNANTVNELELEELMDLGHLDAEERLKLELMVEYAKMGVDPLPDDPTVRAAVNALFLERRGYSTDDSADEMSIGKNEKPVNVQPERILSPELKEQLISTLKARFEYYMRRHTGIEWAQVEARLKEASPEKLWALNEMEKTGGMPDIVGVDVSTGGLIFFDCSEESPEGRRNICYNHEGQKFAERAGWPTNGNAVDMAATMGLDGLLNEKQYSKLGKLVEIDRHTASWIDTPQEEGKKFVPLLAYRGSCNRRYGSENRSDTIGFRGWLKV